MSRILVIDDDMLTARGLAKLLTGHGHEASTAASAEEGFRELAEGLPDAILLDMRMPFINGLGFLYRLRSQPKHRDIPVVVVTGDTTLSANDRDELANLGATVHYKPIDIPRLLALIETLLVNRPAFAEFRRDH